MEEAYTYIANGAQQGLNQNQDLADQVAEYSVYYSEMGLTVDDMFKMMVGVIIGYLTDFFHYCGYCRNRRRFFNQVCQMLG